MKTLIRKAGAVAVLGLVLLMNVSCDKILPNVNINYNDQNADITFTIQPGAQPGDYTFAEKNVTVDLDAIMADNNIPGYELTDATVSSITVTVLTPGKTLDPVENINTWFNSAALGEKRFAYKDNVPNGLTSLEMDLDGESAFPYLKEGTFGVFAKGTLSEAVTEPVELKISTTYKLTFSAK